MCLKVCPYLGHPPGSGNQDRPGHPGLLRRLRHLCGRMSLRGHHPAAFYRSADPAQIDAITEEAPENQGRGLLLQLVLLCRGRFRRRQPLPIPAPVRIIRTMCSGRISTGFIEYAFQRGAAAVLVSGCHLGDCHYINANHQTEKRVKKVWKKMERLGLDKNRLQLAWISAAEGHIHQKNEGNGSDHAGGHAEEIEKSQRLLVPEKKEKKENKGGAE